MVQAGLVVLLQRRLVDLDALGLDDRAYLHGQLILKL
jgi:hypothetical protein